MSLLAILLMFSPHADVFVFLFQFCQITYCKYLDIIYKDSFLIQAALLFLGCFPLPLELISYDLLYLRES